MWIRARLGLLKLVHLRKRAVGLRLKAFLFPTDFRLFWKLFTVFSWGRPFSVCHSFFGHESALGGSIPLGEFRCQGSSIWHYHFSAHITNQWRIQDFCEGGCANPRGGCANLLFCKKLPKNGMKMKEIVPVAFILLGSAYTSYYCHVCNPISVTDSWRPIHKDNNNLWDKRIVRMLLIGEASNGLGKHTSFYVYLAKNCLSFLLSGRRKVIGCVPIVHTQFFLYMYTNYIGLRAHNSPFSTLENTLVHTSHLLFWTVVDGTMYLNPIPIDSSSENESWTCGFGGGILIMKAHSYGAIFFWVRLRFYRHRMECLVWMSMILFTLWDCDLI